MRVENLCQIVAQLEVLRDNDRVEDPAFDNLTQQFIQAIQVNPALLAQEIANGMTLMEEYTMRTLLWDCMEAILDIVASANNPIQNPGKFLAKILHDLITSAKLEEEHDLPEDIMEKFVIAGTDFMKDFEETDSNLFEIIFSYGWRTHMDKILSYCSEEQYSKIVEEYSYKGVDPTMLHYILIDSDKPYDPDFIDLLEGYDIKIRTNYNEDLFAVRIMDLISEGNPELLGENEMTMPMDEDA